MADFAARLAACESPSSCPETQGAVFAALAAPLRELGFHVRQVAGRTSGGQLLAAPSRSPGVRRAGIQLLVGHTDTVWPVGTVLRQPVERRGGRLAGPGVYDMKAGLTQGLYALRALAALGLAPPLAPVWWINSDEEIGSADSLRGLRRLARQARRVFVLEPAYGLEGRLKTARKGSLRFTVLVHGQAAHSGLDPDRGASAIRELARVIDRLYELADRERGITVNVGVVAGGLRANVVAPEARAEVDVRVLSAADGEEIERRVRALQPVTPGTRLEIRGGIDRPPLEATPANRALWEQARRCGAELGFQLDEATVGGGSDGNFTSPLAPTLDGLGAVGDGAHAEHEFVEIDRMPERSALLALLLLAPEAA